MSSIHRPGGLVLSALLSLGLAACGDNNAGPRGDDGDDDGGGGATVPDASGGQLDSGGGQPDSGGGGDKDAGDQEDASPMDGGSDRDAGGAPDAGDLDGGPAPDASTPDGGTPDAGVPDASPSDAGPDPLDGEFLLSLVANNVPAGPVRLITTVDFTESGGGAGTADFTFQPIVATNCAPEMGGLPVGSPVTVTGIPIDATGAFQIVLTQLPLPALANPITCGDITVAEIDVLGTVQSPDLTCGTVTVTLGTLELAGTFGAIRIPPGTVGDDNLPEPVVACP